MYVSCSVTFKSANSRFFFAKLRSTIACSCILHLQKHQLLKNITIPFLQRMDVPRYRWHYVSVQIRHPVPIFFSILKSLHVFFLFLKNSYVCTLLRSDSRDNSSSLCSCLSVLSHNFLTYYRGHRCVALAMVLHGSRSEQKGGRTLRSVCELDYELFSGFPTKLHSIDAHRATVALLAFASANSSACRVLWWVRKKPLSSANEKPSRSLDGLGVPGSRTSGSAYCCAPLD